MAESIFKKHQLDITVDVGLNDAQRKATSAKIKSMANEWQDILDDAIKQGIEQGARSASLKDILTQFNTQLKAFKLEPLTITVDELEIMDKPIEHAAKMVIQKMGDSFKGSGLGNIISEEITDSLNILGGTVDKIYQKMEQGAKKSASNIAKSMREIEDAASKYTKKSDMSKLDSVLRVGVTANKAQKNVKNFYEQSVSTSQSDASWDQKYAADVAFVRNYEALDEKLRKQVFGKQLVEVEAYYTKLAAVHQDKMIALNNILAQNDYIGGKKTKKPARYQLKGVEPWAQEKTLQEVKNILSGGLTVKGDNSGASGDNTKSNKPNTKVPHADEADVDIAEQLKKKEEERLNLAEKRRIEQEKIAEMFKKEAEHANTPKTKTEEMLLDAINNAKGKSTVPWNKTDSADQQRLLQEAIWAKFTPTESADEDIQFDLEYDAFEYSNGKKGKDLSTVAARFDQWTISVEQEFDKASDDVKEIVRKLAMVDDELSQEAWDISEKLNEKNEILARLIEDDHNGSWGNLRNRLRGEGSSAESVEQTNDSLVEEMTLLDKIQKLTSYIDEAYLSSGKHLSDFLNDLQSESNELDTELKEILSTLGLIGDNGEFKFDVKHNGDAGGGTTHNGALISDDFVLIERGDYEDVKSSQLPGGTQNAAKDGINVAEVLGYLPSKYNGGFFDVQGAAKGHSLFENGVISQDVVNATEDQLEQLVQAFIKAKDYGFDIENGGSNIVYDKEKGFSFYDLEELSVDDAEFWNSKTEAEKKLIALENLFSLFSGINRDHANFENDDGVGVLAERIKGVVESRGIVDSNMVDDIGRNYEDIYDDVFSGNIDDEYNDIVALLNAQADAHKKNAAAIIEETQAQEKLNVEQSDGQQIQSKEYVSAPGQPVLSDGAVNNKVSIDEASLENVLNRITYNVKVLHDDGAVDNQFTIDEAALENVLNRVFTNVVNSEAQLSSGEAPWALETTLLSIKEILGQIQTNTTKTESVEMATVSTDIGNVLATENTLVEIKNAVESINSKVVKGTKAKTSNDNKNSGKNNAESYDKSRYFPEKLKTQTMQLAKFRAQLITTGKLTDDVDARIYELLDGLQQVQNGPDFSEWMQKFQQLKTSIGITDIFEKAEDKETAASYEQLIEFQTMRNKLELQYEKAQDGSALKQFYAEQLAQMDSIILKQEEMLENEEYEAKLAKIRAEQEIKLGEVTAKAADKSEKKRLADEKKLAKKQAMVGRAGSAISRAEGVWLEAEGLDQAKLPNGFQKQVEDYYNALDKLRLKHHEINTSDVITDEQQAELREQTKIVNDLTDQLGPLVAEYQKLSGANVNEANSRASTLTDKSGLGDYKAALEQYVKSITDGQGQIKGFNAETKTLTYTVKTGKNEFTEYTAAVRHLDNQFVSLQGTTKRTETFLEATKRKLKEISSYMSGMSALSKATQWLREGIQYVRDIDLALTELKKVTDETEESYDKFLETAAKTADKVGSTIQKVVSSTADWARLGSVLAKTSISPLI